MIKLFNANCIEVLFSEIKPESIDLVVTSPPYDDLREYNNSSTWNWSEFTSIANGLWRAIKKGGVVVWVVGDATINGNETGSSFKQALYFKEIGFNLHDTMIYMKSNFSAVGAVRVRYQPRFEYMFIFSKEKVKTFNPIKDIRRKGKSGWSESHSTTIRKSDGTMRKGIRMRKLRLPYIQRSNIWKINPQTQREKHPAPFPEKLARDHIITWSNEGEIVLDPMMGSNTTGKMAKMLNRSFIGIEIDEEYFAWAKERIDKAKNDCLLKRERKDHLLKILNMKRKNI